MKKIVSSEPMTLHQFNLEQNIPHISQPFSQGYKVVFEDGYIGWAPKEIFDRLNITNEKDTKPELTTAIN